MKEAYFTPESLGPLSQSMLETCRAQRERRPAYMFRPEQAALLVLDMQEYFLQPDSHAFVPSAPAALVQVSRLASAFQQSGRPVIFTRHLNTPEDAGQMAGWWRDLLGPASPLAGISSALAPLVSCLVEKSQYDAFYNTPLEGLLRQQGVTQVVISGVMTHLCCETTARAAFVRGFEVFFTIDATASYTEAFHRASLLNLSHGFAVPVLSGEIERAFDG
jgi:isochorismate hydrolase